jgi:methionyl aminopeptidase
MRIILKSPNELQKMRASGLLVHQLLEQLRERVKPGVTTLDLETFAARKISEAGAKPAFKGYRGFPAVLCTSVNNEIIHGIPSARRVLREGDILKIDTGVILDGYYGDSATTIPVGKISPEVQALMDVTLASLWEGIKQAQVGGHLHDICGTIQDYVESRGYSVVREFVGHGVGRKLHEDPSVPNYRSGPNPRLKEGMVLAIEPMVNQGKADTKVLADKWTAVAVDGRCSAHFEHTVALLKEGPWVLTQP